MGEEITRDDIKYTVYGDQHQMTKESVLACHGKVNAFLASQKTRSFKIDRPFERICATGKVHADLPKLIQVLVSAGLIRYERQVSSMYDAVFNLKWIARDTLLVICGDLINGQRKDKDGGVSRVDDQAGSFEMLLHCMLFNLRLQARNLGSDILLVLGDHEINSIFLHDRSSQWIETFACPAHLRFAPKLSEYESTRASEDRAIMLAPFLMCSPFLMIRLGGIVFANGGFSHSTVDYARIYEQAAEAQKEIDKIVFDVQKPHEFTETTSDIIEKYTRAAIKGGLSVSIAEVSGYRELSKANMCYREETKALQSDGVDLVVVGQGGRVQNPGLDEDVKACQGQNHDGCVITRSCPSGLLVALVDTAMSACFRKDPSTNKHRNLEILELIQSTTGGARGAGVNYYPYKRMVGPQGASMVTGPQTKRAFRVSETSDTGGHPAKSDPEVTETGGPPFKGTEMAGHPAKGDPEVGPRSKRVFKVSQMTRFV